MSTRHYEIALGFLEDIGPVTARTLVSYCGSAEAVFREKKEKLLKIPGVGDHRSKFANRDEALKLAEGELELIDKYKLQTFFYLDDNYPHRLKAYQDSPILLYGKGILNFNADRLLAVVGTRKQTDYGRMKCEQIIQELRESGVTIVSGLAYGIDAISHKASVKNRMPTIGVLGNGLPDVYPKAHASLVRSMLEHDGGLISQFHCHAMPDREHFPMRNKTVAYMTDATLVIESKASGGSMITANFAFHNFKELFALPGRSIDVSSEGCNKLIKANMAQLVTCGDDILKSMSWDAPRKQKAIQSTLFLELSDDEKLLVDIIRDAPDIHIDQIASKSQLPNSVMITLLLHLELQGLIKQTVGKRYIMGR